MRWLTTALVLFCGVPAHGEGLEALLLSEPAESLGQAAREQGDPVRGAILFHQPTLACTRCHAVGDALESLGPDLTRLPDGTTDADLVDAVLRPSQQIRKGYEAVTLLLKDGRVVTGLPAQPVGRIVNPSNSGASDDRPSSAGNNAERDGLTIRPTGQGEVRLRDSSTGRVLTFAAGEVEQHSRSEQSIMPPQQAGQLASRQQFLDLIAYLIALRDGGAAKARELQPPAALYALQLPEYESRVDHAGLLRELDHDAFRRGEANYQRLCINCHGDHERPGSLPRALRFAEGRFKNGSDPYAMYQTLTRGFGFMVPQTWMVPRQKYDVIHYIREAYLKDHNAKQYVAVTDTYLAGLPAGDTKGPPPREHAPWSDMDYGPHLVGTYELPIRRQAQRADEEAAAHNIAYKGIAVRLDAGPGGVAHGKAWMVFDHDTLRVAGAWTAGAGDRRRFIDWQGISFDGRHGTHPKVIGEVHLSNPVGPGWADPATGSFADEKRVLGRDGRRYGPLPREWAKFRGFYAHEEKTILSYAVGQAEVLEMPGFHTVGRIVNPSDSSADGMDGLAIRPAEDPLPVFTRTFNIGPRDHDLTLLVAADAAAVTAGLSIEQNGLQLRTDRGRLLLVIPRGEEPLKFVLWTAATGHSDSPPPNADDVRAAIGDAAPDLSALTQGGRPRWPERVTTQRITRSQDGPFAVDEMLRPTNNPWLARTRLTGLDFFEDRERMVVTAWDGDVWMVTVTRPSTPAIRDANPGSRIPAVLTWQRIASGLFQPLGVKVVDGDIFVTCRDQIVILRDLNGDGETDFYECFNNDHQVTEHFHEFAMGLQRDDDGYFYYAKSARHALPALVPHHGTLLRVSPDGERTEVLANGFRAANGVCLNPDGTFIVTDQEGHWNPKNRINWVTPGTGGDTRFYGNMYGYHDVTDESDEAMQPPLCWITNAFDRSPAELLWVDSPRWGPLQGSLLNFSYGYGKVYLVPFEEVGGLKQGGMCALPIERLPTGIMRGRFSPHDGQLYTCGMFAWASSQQGQEGGVYRVRMTGKPAWLPVALHARQSLLQIRWSDPVDPQAASDPQNYAVKVWSLKRTKQYGSDHYDEHPLEVTAVEVSKDGRTTVLHIPDLAPTWCMEIRCLLHGPDGERIERVIHNTIHALGD
jgi:putative heme-binding domain-containing protein